MLHRLSRPLRLLGLLRLELPSQQRNALRKPPIVSYMLYSCLMSCIIFFMPQSPCFKQRIRHACHRHPTRDGLAPFTKPLLIQHSFIIRQSIDSKASQHQAAKGPFPSPAAPPPPEPPHLLLRIRRTQAYLAAYCLPANAYPSIKRGIIHHIRRHRPLEEQVV